jgi:predicted DCC family thiol-disulfide oxidoreductase YuxK
MNQSFNQALLYDDNCPLCAAYTSAFVKTGLLDADKRISFSQINIADYAIDYNKARHEIPLVNLKNGQVKYGVDALAEILDQQFRFVKPMLKIKPINWFFRKLYRLISYNRKIIVAKPNIQNTCFDCAPDYSVRHRFYLIVFTWVVTNFLLLNVVGEGLQKRMINFQSWWLFGWMLVTILMIVNKPKKQALDIAVHVGIIMMIATIIYSITLYFFQLLFTFHLIFYCIALASTLLWAQWQIRRRKVFHQQQCIG